MVVVLPPEVDEQPPQRRDWHRVGVGFAVVALVLGGVALGWWLRGSTGTAGPTAVPLGDASDFAVGTIVERNLDAGFYDPVGVEIPGPDEEGRPGPIAPARLFVVSHPEHGLLALAQRSPFRGCRMVVATAADARGYGHTPPGDFVLGFLDPCHGGLFALDGTHLAGPGSRSLDRFPVGYLPDGTVTVDLTAPVAS